ncbi:putative rna polymerase iii subunit c17 [Diaporthe ampelina]|uniref:DNA-directed RNA polymerase III subunit RPC9 n=1 Tax=Diaporthe ampelina TaxID=1214573 RepID=A0A0G2F737_9PEZI|nr:putative rna polymerase iii subunit c17 [Diaporthe ampelina]
MKILESQSATLTNFEVYQHLLNEQQKAKLPDRKRQVPRSLQTVIKEKLTLTQVIDQLRTQPDPLSQRPVTYDATSISRLVERLRDYDLTKGETIMIINLRPDNPAVLAACVEDAESRFDEEKQQEILAIIEEVLGPLPVKEAAEA